MVSPSSAARMMLVCTNLLVVGCVILICADSLGCNKNIGVGLENLPGVAAAELAGWTAVAAATNG